MFATNIIAMEDCTNRKATCQECTHPILPTHPRVRAAQRKYCHLNCYKPKYPVTILPESDVTNSLHSPENQALFSSWIHQWNVQFSPRDMSSLPSQTVPSTSPINRLYLEIFKFLTHHEICLLAGRTCKEWLMYTWNQELWVDLIARDFQDERRDFEVSAREGYMRLRAETCLACCKRPQEGQIRVVCPLSQRPICSSCFQKPGSSVFKVHEYAKLMGISQDYMREACVPVYSYNSSHWVFSHQADLKIQQYRLKRRSEMLETLTQIPNFFTEKDLEKIKTLNPSRAKYIGVFLKHKFREEEDLIDLLQFIFASCDRKGLNFSTLLKRNRRRKIATMRMKKGIQTSV